MGNKSGKLKDADVKASATMVIDRKGNESKIVEHKGNESKPTEAETNTSKCELCSSILLDSDKYAILLPSKVKAICKNCDIRNGKSFADLQHYKYEPYHVGDYSTFHESLEICDICSLSKEYRRSIMKTNIDVCKTCYDNFHNVKEVTVKYYRKLAVNTCQVCKNNPTYADKYSLIDMGNSVICAHCAVRCGAGAEDLNTFVHKGKCKPCSHDDFLVDEKKLQARTDMCQSCWINFNKV